MGPTRAHVVAYAGWLAVGALGCFGVLGLLTIGPPFLLVAAVLTAVLGRAYGVGRPIAGVAAGMALPIAYVGWLDRHGPGTYCTTTGSGGLSCADDLPSPIPFFVVAAVLVTASVVVVWWGRRGTPARR